MRPDGPEEQHNTLQHSCACAHLRLASTTCAVFLASSLPFEASCLGCARAIGEVAHGPTPSPGYTGTKAKIQRRHEGALCHGNSWCSLQTPVKSHRLRWPKRVRWTAVADREECPTYKVCLYAVPLSPPGMLAVPCLCSGPAVSPGAPRCVGCAGECLGRVPKRRQRHPAIRLLNPVVQSCNAHTHRSMHVP